MLPRTHRVWYGTSETSCIYIHHFRLSINTYIDLATMKGVQQLMAIHVDRRKVITRRGSIRQSSQTLTFAQKRIL